MTTESIISIFLGIGLAASAGFRVFLPLFALSLASYFGAYFIPWVDNLLDSFAIPLAGIAGTVVMVSTVADLEPLVTWILAIIAGGGTATAIKGASATSRLASTATTGGLANPIISAVETGTALVVTILSLLVPIAAVILVIVILGFIFNIYRKLRPKI